jgi:uncharacterized protein YllA (UPF0747 family)
MLEGKEGRDRLVANGAGFRTRHGGERYSRDEILGLLEREPGRFSGNVLLRPVLERSILPTVAYVAGPGELRYLALAEAVYAQVGVSPQLPVPRWSGLLVEPRVDRVLAKFGASLEELLAPAARLESRVARERLPAKAVEAIAALREGIERQYRAIEAAAVDIDPTLERPIRGLKGRALQGADRPRADRAVAGGPSPGARPHRGPVPGPLRPRDPAGAPRRDGRVVRLRP